MRTLLITLAVGCSGGGESPPIPLQTALPLTTIPETLDLHGNRPAQNLAAPSFSSVKNRDGSPRTREDLVGQPTVLWFYPAANTGG